ncbi:MAG: hypothetical protein ACLFQX_13130 [Candidatus Kapaibacterium sp.]
MTEQTPSIPGGSKPVGQGSSGGGNYYYNPSQPKPRKAVKLHVGEVVHGTILDVLGPREAVVRLPIGVVHAYLNGDLRKGDSLMFKVAETQPSLVLRVYAASVRMRNKDVPVAELLRMLDLPPIDFYKEYIKYVRRLRTQINREDAHLMYGAYAQLDEDDLIFDSYEEIIRVFFSMQEAGMPMESELFRKVSPLFLGAGHLSILMKNLERGLDRMPAQHAGNFRYNFDKLSSETVNVSQLITFFTIRESKENEPANFYTSLLQFSELADDRLRRELQAQIITVSEIMEMIEAMNLWNAISAGKNGLLNYFVPVVRKNDYMIAKVAIQHQKAARVPVEKTVYFSLKSQTKDLGELIVRGSSIGDSLKVEMLSGDENTANYLKGLADEFRSSLERENYHLLAFHVGLDESQDINLLPEQTHLPATGFTMVV